MQDRCAEGTEPSKWRKWSQSKDQGREKLPRHKWIEGVGHQVGFLNEEDIHQHDHSANIQQTGSGADSVLVNVHVFGVKLGDVAVPDLPPVTVSTVDPETFPSSHRFSLTTFTPWEVLTMGIQLEDFSRIEEDFRLVLVKGLVGKNNQGRNSLEAEDFSHDGGLGSIVLHGVKTPDLGTALVKVLLIAIIADKDGLALFFFQVLLCSNDRWGEFRAEGTVVGSKEESDVFVSLKERLSRHGLSVFLKLLFRSFDIECHVGGFIDNRVVEKDLFTKELETPVVINVADHGVGNVLIDSSHDSECVCVGT
mmetsp:Transcript_12053/g.28854  ORF Transcript_12053/g.28854 Transcript_12053/m.28854 type:complete len:308 (+) Transcript_12053:898-1821(+)